MTSDLNSPISEWPDWLLWSAVQQGQANALGVLYDRHAGLVYGIAYKVLQNPQDAEDLTQEIFVRLPQMGYDPERGSLRTYLAVLTRSRALDLLRSKQRNQSSLEKFRHSQMGIDESNSEDSAYLEEMHPAIQEALVQLSENQRRVLDLAYKEGLSQTEIAQQLDVPLGTVKTWARRGLLKLRQTLQLPSNEEKI
jgi:RNA polymerase sigma-70 factor, ECF subfamily